MIFQPTCRVSPPAINPQLYSGLQLFESIRKQMYPNASEMIVTSLNDSNLHRVGSLHYRDMAADIRSHDLSHIGSDQLLRQARQQLGEDYGLILEDPQGENQHFHLQVSREGLAPY